VAGLAVIEFLEDVGGKLGVLPNKGVELMIGRCWGVDGWVGVSRHVSAVEDAEGVLTEGGVGLTVFKGGSLLRFSALSPFARGWWFRGVDIVEVPCWGW